MKTWKQKCQEAERAVALLQLRLEETQAKLDEQTKQKTVAFDEALKQARTIH